MARCASGRSLRAARLATIPWLLSLSVGCGGANPGYGGGGGNNGMADMARMGGGAGGGGGNGMPDLAGTNADMYVDPLVAKLLALTANCTTANMVSAHVYPDPGSMMQNVPICALKGAVYFNADMDIDCDGRPTPNKCPGPDPSYQPDTSFHNLMNQPLEAAVTPYVVIPLDFMYPGLDTQNGGNVVAVIYNHQLEYAVFGDTGPTNLIGEASYATAANLGIDPNPATGGVGSGVTYIVFVGNGSAPMNIENQAETRALGAMLTADLLTNN